MMQTWSNWKRFPDVKGGDCIEAPAGPGVYEVSHTLTGRVMAFGHAGNVAKTIADLKFDGEIGPLGQAFPPAAAGVAALRPRIPHLRRGEPRRRQDRRAAALGSAAERLAPAARARLGGAPPGLNFAQ